MKNKVAQKHQAVDKQKEFLIKIVNTIGDNDGDAMTNHKKNIFSTLILFRNGFWIFHNFIQLIDQQKYLPVGYNT